MEESCALVVDHAGRSASPGQRQSHCADIYNVQRAGPYFHKVPRHEMNFAVGDLPNAGAVGVAEKPEGRVALSHVRGDLVKPVPLGTRIEHAVQSPVAVARHEVGSPCLAGPVADDPLKILGYTIKVVQIAIAHDGDLCVVPHPRDARFGIALADDISKADETAGAERLAGRDAAAQSLNIPMDIGDESPGAHASARRSQVPGHSPRRTGSGVSFDGIQIWAEIDVQPSTWSSRITRRLSSDAT